MPFDSTAMGIIIALIGAGIFVGVELIHRKDIEIRNTLVIYVSEKRKPWINRRQNQGPSPFSPGAKR
uniref:Uncharacterized protein n=1 Tax=Candidatus Kentrum sp. SD TaxID=2126332 RepID=A0A450Y5J7_9GAMM|nr:MAG: hypothetical protein BECKSD772F_GA0070984_10066 [Candidatus Kentron sp. SD]VFK44887.1 MAG: hypothetical protein BECKSD772E_GA0070983_10455 [Candidatus Kentron sp. SD]VFK78033.1 MAG: hypothetical protein BECKSD772D_GA0070982_100536 [Candidatus Kentron sp. SD]